MTATELELRKRIAADIIAELTRAEAQWQIVPDPNLSVLTGRAWFASAMRKAAAVARGDLPVGVGGGRR